MRRDGLKLGDFKSQEWIDNYDNWEKNRDEIQRLANDGRMDEAQELLKEQRGLMEWLKNYDNPTQKKLK